MLDSNVLLQLDSSEYHFLAYRFLKTTQKQLPGECLRPRTALRLRWAAWALLLFAPLSPGGGGLLLPGSRGAALGSGPISASCTE